MDGFALSEGSEGLTFFITDMGTFIDHFNITGYKRKAFLLWRRAGTRPFRYGFVKIDM